MPETVVVKVSDIPAGQALDWLAGKAKGLNVGFTTYYAGGPPEPCYFEATWENENEDYCISEYSTCWYDAGPIIEENCISITWGMALERFCLAELALAPRSVMDTTRQTGATPLEAAMRCFVAHRLGLEVVLPVELLRFMPDHPLSKKYAVEYPPPPQRRREPWPFLIG